MPVVSRVTVLTAAYQDGQFIQDALDSVMANVQDLHQHNKDTLVEMVLVNDGSRDNTAEVVHRFSVKSKGHLELKYITQNNQGQAAAFQNALPFIQGEIVLLLDADDRFLPQKIRKVTEAFAANPGAGMVTHPLLVIDAEGRATGDIRPKAARLSHGSLQGLIQRTGRCVVPATSGLAFSRELFLEIHPSPLTAVTYAADAYLSLAAAMRKPVYALAEPLAEYRQHQGSQYFERLTTKKGLVRQVELQEIVARHLGIKDVLRKNSFFARNTFGVEKIQGGISKWFPALLDLNKAIWIDPHFTVFKKALFVCFWSATAFLPKALFWKIWIFFYRIQTGYR
jgi:glycosyltransferase involved in cell wall biosynthesis